MSMTVVMIPCSCLGLSPRVWECINISKWKITMSRSRGKFRVLKTFFTTLETGDLSRQTCKRCLTMFDNFVQDSENTMLVCILFL